MELCALDTVCAGCSLALAGGFYYLYRRQRAAVRRIQAADRLQVGAELRTLLEAPRELSYVVLQGRVEAAGTPLCSQNHPHLLAVIQKNQMVEHRLFWNSLTKSWLHIMYMTTAERVIVAAALLMEGDRQEEVRVELRRSKRKRRMWTREWLEQRSKFTHMHLVRELQEKNPQDFQNDLRMSEESFKLLLECVRPLIERQDTRMRAAVSAEVNLAVTLHFLSTGRSMKELQFSAAVSRSLLSVLIPETCNAIVRSLRSYMPFPKSVAEWQKIASDFERIWQFPNCGGALDGKRADHATSQQRILLL
ncbi:uncharacterized protein [Dendrobates tinctorius]|uniref:uncharacterized protein isoform X2 n=1 Tax=Dendrobates tinctorius TaxID=92724 RepID=UPI003CC9DA86